MKPCVAAKSEPCRWGLLGGTFDPPHWGHLRLAEAAREELGLGLVIFLPNRQPPHKPGAQVTEAQHRYVMTELACAEHPAFTVCRMELDRPGPSYSIDTIRQVRREGPQGLELYFLIGLDMACELPTWREPDAVLAEATVVAAPRGDLTLEALTAAIGPQRAAQVRPLSMPPLEIASTRLREMLRAGRSVRYLLPPAVEAYLHKHHLYRKEPD